MCPWCNPTTSSIVEVNSMTDSLTDSLTVGELAARSGVAVSTIHFYESKGLINSVRNAGNQRRFARAELRPVAIIKVGQRAGISLNENRHAPPVLRADRA